MEDDGSGPLIVLAEDSDVVRETLTMKLEKGGYRVEADPAGDAVYRLAGEMQPSVVLLDIKLPKTDGIQILKTLKGDPKTSMIPVFMLTNLTDQRLITEAVTLGARGYFVKSEMSFDEVLAKVDSLFQK